MADQPDSPAPRPAPRPAPVAGPGHGGVTQPRRPNGNGGAADPNAVILCPYCGRTQRGGDRCGACGGLWEPLSRMATQIAMGPWFIRDKNKPFQPGCSYDTIRRMAQRGKLKPITVLRGPTTHQFWSVARNVPGVAHLVGFCHHCGSHVDPGADQCGKCNTRFYEPHERNKLGLQYPSEEAIRIAERELEQRMRARVRVNARLAEEDHDEHGFTDDFIEESLNEVRMRLASAEGADQTAMGIVHREPSPRETTPGIDAPLPPAQPVVVEKATTPQEIEDPRATPLPESHAAAPRPASPIAPAPAREPVSRDQYQAAGDWEHRGQSRLLMVLLVLLILLCVAILAVLAYATWFADGTIEVFGIHLGTGGIGAAPAP